MRRESPAARHPGEVERGEHAPPLRWSAYGPIGMLPAMSVSRMRAASDRSVAMPTVAFRSVVAGAAFAMLFALGCNRSERESSPAPSAAPFPPPVTEPVAPSTPIADAVAAPGASQQKGGSATSTACNTDSDCRMFSDACGICSCRPFAKTSPDPKCPGGRMACLIDPCTGLGVFCRKGNCALGPPGDAAGGTTSVPAKDAGVADVAAKGAGSAAPTASAKPKVTDAARD